MQELYVRLGSTRSEVLHLVNRHIEYDGSPCSRSGGISMCRARLVGSQGRAEACTEENKLLEASIDCSMASVSMLGSLVELG